MTGDVPRPLGVPPGPIRGEQSSEGPPEERVGALQAGFGPRVEQADPGGPPAAALVLRGWLHVHVHERALGFLGAWQRRRCHSAACSQSVEPNQPCLEKTTPHFLNYVPDRKSVV